MCRRFWLLALCVGVFTALAAQMVGAAITYTDPQGRVSFRVPDGYRSVAVPAATPSEEGQFHINLVAGYIRPLASGDRVTIALQMSDKQVTRSLSSIVDEAVQGDVDDASFVSQVGGVQSVTLGGQPAQRYEILRKNDAGSTRHFSSVFTVVNRYVYEFYTATADADFGSAAPDFAATLNTVSFGAPMTAATTTTTVPSTTPATTTPATATPATTTPAATAGTGAGTGQAPPATTTTTTTAPMTTATPVPSSAVGTVQTGTAGQTTGTMAIPGNPGDFVPRRIGQG